MDRRTVLLAALMWMGVPGITSAGMFDYNLVVTKKLDTNQEVEGRAFVRNLKLSNVANFGIKPAATGGDNTLDTLSVAESISTGNLNLQRGVYRHTNPLPPGLSVNYNGGSSHQMINIIPEMNALEAELATTSNHLASLTSNSSYSTENNNLTFSLNYNSAGQAVVNLPASVLSIMNLQLNSLPSIPSDKTLIINVTSITSAIDWHINSNAPAALAQNVLWNFNTDMDIDLNLHSRFTGSILGPNIQLSNTTAIEGGVYVENFTMRGEVHLPLSDGTTNAVPAFVGIIIPEPAPLALLPALALATLRRRSR